MDSKFSTELEKIEKLLNKVDVDLNTDFTKVDFSTFFKNVDKTFEIYNICLEELCGQLYLLELPMHSKVVRKLYHHYKHQLYNIMKFQLNLQREINEKTDQDKNNKIKIETLSAKLTKTSEKKRRLKQQIDEMRAQIDGLNTALSAANNREILFASREVEPQEEAASGRNIADASKMGFRFGGKTQRGNAEERQQSRVSMAAEEQEETDPYDMGEVNKLLNENIDTEQPEQNREYVLKLLRDIEGYRKEINDLKGIKEKSYEPVQTRLLESKVTEPSFISPVEPPRKPLFLEVGLNTVGEFTTLEEFKAIVGDLDKVTIELDDAKAVMDQERHTFSKKEADFKKRIAELTEEAAQDKENFIYLDNLSKERSKRIAELEDNLAKTLQQSNEAKEENQLLTDIIKKCENRLAELENVNQTLKNELIQLESAAPNYDDQIERIKSLSQENLEMSKKIDRLEEASQKVNLNVDENMERLLEVKNKKIEKLETEVQKLMKHNKSCLKKASDLDERVKGLTRNVAELTKQNGELQKNNNGLKGLVHNLGKRLETMNPRLTNKRKTIAAEMGLVYVASPGGKDAGRSSETENSGSGTVKNRMGGVVLQGEVGQFSLEQKRSKDSIVRSDVSGPNAVASENTRELGSESHGQQSAEETTLVKVDSRAQFFDTLGDRNDSEMQEYLDQYLNQEALDRMDSIRAPKFDQQCQTDYASVIDYIIEKEEDIRYNEVDLERIKEAADILADMIGFMGIQDYAAVVNQQAEIAVEEQSPEKENKRGTRRNERSQSRKEEPVKGRIVKNGKPSKLIIKKNPNVRKPEIVGEEKPDLEFPQIEMRDVSAKLRPQKKNTLVRVKVERHDGKDADSEDDYIVQKSKLIRNHNKKNETYEVVEYIRVPKQLNIAKKDLPPAPDDGLNDTDHDDMKRITGMPNLSFQQNTIEKEKLFFRVYLNIKHRYQGRPERFIEIYKLTFNKVPVFESRLDESYDPKRFLFNFSEFKQYFAAIINSHQICGPDCVHFSRFYKKTGIVTEHCGEGTTVGNAYVQELPKLLEA